MAQMTEAGRPSCCVSLRQGLALECQQKSLLKLSMLQTQLGKHLSINLPVTCPHLKVMFMHQLLITPHMLLYLGGRC